MMGKIKLNKFHGISKLNIFWFVVLILMARASGERLAVVFMDIAPDFDSVNIFLFLQSAAVFLGYGAAGVVMGIAINYILGDLSRRVLGWLPILLLCADFVISYLNLFSAGRAGDWSVYNITALNLRYSSGYAYLFLMPFVSSLVIWIIEIKKSDEKKTISGFFRWFKESIKTTLR